MCQLANPCLCWQPACVCGVREGWGGRRRGFCWDWNTISESSFFYHELRFFFEIFIKILNYCFFFFFFPVLGLELMAFTLKPYFCEGFFKIRSRELFARAGFELDPPDRWLWIARITGVSHRRRSDYCLLKDPPPNASPTGKGVAEQLGFFFFFGLFVFWDKISLRSPACLHQPPKQTAWVLFKLYTTANSFYFYFFVRWSILNSPCPKLVNTQLSSNISIIPVTLLHFRIVHQPPRWALKTLTPREP
jgi:hypothetical protein